MKVLQINSCSGCLSTGRIATDIGAELLGAGHDCLIAYRLASVDRGVPTYKMGSAWAVKLNTFLARITDRTGFTDWFATKRLLRKIDSYQPDIVHLHTLHGDYINIQLLLSHLKRHNYPAVITMHDCWLITGHCAHFITVGCEKWKGICSSCPAKHTYPKSYFVDQSERNHTQKQYLLTQMDNLILVPVSTWLSNMVSNSHLSSVSRFPIHNGIDLSVFKPVEGSFRSKFLLEDKKIILGVASNWTKKKGLDDFIELSKMLSNDYTIVLVGLRSDQMKSLSSGMIGIMRTSNIQELVEIYTAADIFLNLTYEDTAPMVNIEAQACGTPVIVYDTGGCPETVAHDTGIVVNQGVLDEVVRAIDIVIDSDIITSDTCRKNAELNFDRQKNAESYMKIYEAMIAQTNKS